MGTRLKDEPRVFRVSFQLLVVLRSPADGYLAEFTHILQCLTTIPKNAPFLWSTIEKIVGKATLPVRKRQLQGVNDQSNSTIDSKSDDNSSAREFSPAPTYPSLMELKTLLSRARC